MGTTTVSALELGGWMDGVNPSRNVNNVYNPDRYLPYDTNKNVFCINILRWKPIAVKS